MTNGEKNRRDAHPHMNNLVYGRRSAPSSDPIVDVGSVDELGVRRVGVHSDSVGGEMTRRAAHPHMNNLVYGRRSDPAAASYLDDDELSAAVCRKVISRCARWQRQLDSESY